MNKFVGTGPSSYEKKHLPARGLTKVEKHWSTAPYSICCVFLAVDCTEQCKLPLSRCTKVAARRKFYLTKAPSKVP